MSACGSWIQASSAHTNKHTHGTMKRSGSQYWEVRNSSAVALVFHGDAEHENDSVSLYRGSA